MMFQRFMPQLTIFSLRNFYKLSLISFVCFLQISTAYAFDKQAIGWLEHIRINNSEYQLKAKIDTGAATTSINAIVLKKYKKNNERWIRFQVENKQGQKIVLDRKIQRYVKIKRKLALSTRRPVIKLGVCIANVYRDLEVNLSDRKNFQYHVLIGRNFLRGRFLVDSELEYTTEPACK